MARGARTSRVFFKMSQFDTDFAATFADWQTAHGESVEYWRDGEQVATATALGIEEMANEPADDMDGRGLKKMRRVHLSTQASDGIATIDEQGSLKFRSEEWNIESKEDETTNSVTLVVSRYSATERSQLDARFRR